MDSHQVSDLERVDANYVHQTSHASSSMGFAMNTISAGGNISFNITAAAVGAAVTNSSQLISEVGEYGKGTSTAR
jgi:hypothetical protein